MKYKQKDNFPLKRQQRLRQQCILHFRNTCDRAACILFEVEPSAGTRSQWERRREWSTARGGARGHTRSTPSDGDEVAAAAAATDPQSNSRVCTADLELFFQGGHTGDAPTDTQPPQRAEEEITAVCFTPPPPPRDCHNRCSSTTCITIWSSKPSPPRWKMHTLNRRVKFWTTSASTKTLGWLWSKSKPMWRNMDRTVSS